MSSWCLIMKKKKVLCESMFVQIEKRTLILKNGRKKAFTMKPSINVIYLNEENVLMVPNHERKEDYYVNLCLSKLTNEH